MARYSSVGEVGVEVIGHPGLGVEGEEAEDHLQAAAGQAGSGERGVGSWLAGTWRGWGESSSV